MSLTDYHWEQKESSSSYAGMYVTHGRVNKDSIVDQLEGKDLELKDHVLEYGDKKLEVRLDVNREWMAFFYDETFEEELGDENFDKVLTYFLTPDKWKNQSEVHPAEK